MSASTDTCTLLMPTSLQAFARSDERGVCDITRGQQRTLTLVFMRTYVAESSLPQTITVSHSTYRRGTREYRAPTSTTASDTCTLSAERRATECLFQFRCDDVDSKPSEAILATSLVSSAFSFLAVSLHVGQTSE
jgi:hypothetical protein